MLVEKDCAVQPSVVNKSLNLGTNANRIDPALEIISCDMIRPMHCLSSLKMWRSRDVIMAPAVQPRVAYLFEWLTSLFKLLSLG